MTGYTKSRDATAPPPPNFLKDVGDKQRHHERETNLLELLDGSLVNTSALVDQVTCCMVSGLYLFPSSGVLTSSGGLAGVDMADDDDVDMSLLFTVAQNMSAVFIDIFLDLHSIERRIFGSAYPMVNSV